LRKMNDVLARTACDFEHDTRRRQDTTKDAENGIAIAQGCWRMLTVIGHLAHPFPECRLQVTRSRKNRRHRETRTRQACEVRDEIRDKLALVFEDMGEQQVENTARPVRVVRVAAPVTEQPNASTKPALALPEPFTNLSGDPEQDYFADSVVEDIVSALSRVGGLIVIARNSSFTYKGRTVDIKQVGRELGGRYALEGSVRKASNRVPITGQLVDAATGLHVWADHFDGALGDIFDLQDRVPASVAGIIEPKLQNVEMER
jgi:TolB-like protein